MRNALLAATALVSSTMFLVPGAQAFDWNGKYVGGVVGVVKSNGSIDWTFYDDIIPDFATGTFEFDGVGGLVGVTSGINFQLDDKFVVGIEGDASLAFLKSSGIDDTESYYYAEFDEKLEALLTLRGRAGILTEDKQTLFFVTGGVAGGNVSATAAIEETGIDGDPPEAVQMSGFAIGVIGGIGVEHAITDDLTVKAELLGYALGSLDGTGYAGKGDSVATYNPSGIIFRTGINFHF